MISKLIFVNIFAVVTAIGEGNVLVQNCPTQRACRDTSYSISISISGVELGDTVRVTGWFDCMPGYQTEYGNSYRNAFFCDSHRSK